MNGFQDRTEIGTTSVDLEIFCNFDLAKKKKVEYPISVLFFSCSLSFKNIENVNQQENSFES
jgi:hypothetical protein